MLSWTLLGHHAGDAARLIGLFLLVTFPLEEFVHGVPDDVVDGDGGDEEGIDVVGLELKMDV